MRNPVVDPSRLPSQNLQKIPTRRINNKQRPLRPIERRFPHQTFHDGEAVAVRSYVRTGRKATRRTGSSVSRNCLKSRGIKSTGRPRELTFREALVITCGYMRQNIIEDVWADIFDVDQSTISRIITFLTPLVEQATAEFRPAPEEAAEATRDAIALVDGTLWPCWSWDGERELWSGKYKTTGHGSLIVTNLQGRITFVSEPVTGNQHDMAKLKGSAVEKILKKAGGVFGDKGFIGTDYITTPIRKPECRELLAMGTRVEQSGEFLPRAGRARRRHLEDMADSLHRLPSAAEDL